MSSPSANRHCRSMFFLPQALSRTCSNGDDKLVVDKFWASPFTSRSTQSHIWLDFTLALFLGAYSSLPHYHNNIWTPRQSSSSTSSFFTSTSCTSFITVTVKESDSKSLCRPQTPEREKLNSEEKTSQILSSSSSLAFSLWLVMPELFLAPRGWCLYEQVSHSQPDFYVRILSYLIVSPSFTALGRVGGSRIFGFPLCGRRKKVFCSISLQCTAFTCRASSCGKTASEASPRQPELRNRRRL